MEIEVEFDIDILNDDVEKFETMQDVINYVLQNPKIRLQYATPEEINKLADYTTRIVNLLYPREPFAYYDGPIGGGEIKSITEDLKEDN